MDRALEELIFGARNEQLEKLCAAYYKLTSIPPDQALLVEQRISDPPRVTWHVELHPLIREAQNAALRLPLAGLLNSITKPDKLYTVEEIARRLKSILKAPHGQTMLDILQELDLKFNPPGGMNEERAQAYDKERDEKLFALFNRVADNVMRANRGI